MSTTLIAGLPRYNFYCSWDGGGPAEPEEDNDGDWVQFSDVQAALAQSDAQPAGWKLVPLEPTPEMMKCADRIIGPDPRFMRMTWTAMLNAAPSLAASPQEAQPTRERLTPEQCNAAIQQAGLWAVADAADGNAALLRGLFQIVRNLP